MKTVQLFFWAAVSIVFTIVTAYGQSDLLATTFAAGDYTRCLQLCDSMLSHDDSDASAHYYKGASLVNLKDFRQAQEHLKKGQQLGFSNQLAIDAYQLRAAAGLLQTSIVLKMIDSLAAAGFAAVAVFQRPEFEYLKGDAKFARAKTKVDRNANPCVYNSGHKKLDFWLGEWDVYTGGTKTADSYITKSKGGCTLHEDYRTATGFFGSSYNYLDPQDSLYKQIWIDKFNNITRFHEVESAPGRLVMQAVGANNNLVRMTYQLDEKEETVTQTMEGSSDEGKNWNVTFVGVYKPKTMNK